MFVQLSFFVSIAFAVLAWGIVAKRYFWPHLRDLPAATALRPILILHSFRFEGLTFLIPGVVAPDLPSAFAHAAAYGDLVAAVLAVFSLALLPRRAGITAAWVFNIWGTADLLNAFYQANESALVPGQLGAAYFIPTVLVPLLLTTHALAFRILLRSQTQSRVEKQQNARPATARI